MNILNFFSDPVLRAPTVASMLMCMTSAVVGVLVFVKKRSLLGEALSHATYPGVTAAIILSGVFSLDTTLPFCILIGAFLSAIVGFWAILFLEKKCRVSSDGALSAVLSLFFGIGVLLASIAQNSYAHLYRQIQAYLYGQAVTMTDIHILIYGTLALIILLFVIIFYKQILTLCFDVQFAYTVGIANKWLELGIFLMVVLSLVIGVRCVGVILMSAMLIAPAVAARQFTNKLSIMFLLSAIFGGISALFGVYSSLFLSEKIERHYAVPTGPMIVLISASLALYALFFAPNRGLVIRYLRIAQFKSGCCKENLLKAIWRLEAHNRQGVSFKNIVQHVGFSALYVRLLLFRLMHQKAVIKNKKSYFLTESGLKQGARIVRLHRLWEVYLVHSLGLNIERVHKNAEEMEHILTPALEKQLTELLDNPSQDPHAQPIPNYEGVVPNVF